MTASSEQAIRQWWRTSIIDMAPGKIEFRGHPIQELIGTVSFGQMIWLMTLGHMPSLSQAQLLECALVAGVDLDRKRPLSLLPAWLLPSVLALTMLWLRV